MTNDNDNDNDNDNHADDVGYTNHTGFGGLVGQVRHGFANAATEVEEARTASEAIAKAGLDWSVSKRPLWFTGKSNGSKPKKVENAFAMVKDDDESYLGTVGKQYHPIQNDEAFGWADLVPGTYVAGGSLKKNRSVYLIKSLDKKIEAAGDETELYLMLRSSHDGTKSLSAMVTPVRIRCMNMMPIATRRAKVRFAVRHVTTFEAKLAQAAEIAGLVDAYAFQFKAIADQLADVKVSADALETVLKAVLPGRTELQDGVKANLASSTTIADDQRETGWGVFNAITEFVEWGRVTNNRQNALQANIDGQGARIRNAAAQQLLAIGGN